VEHQTGVVSSLFLEVRSGRSYHLMNEIRGKQKILSEASNQGLPNFLLFGGSLCDSLIQVVVRFPVIGLETPGFLAPRQQRSGPTYPGSAVNWDQRLGKGTEIQGTTFVHHRNLAAQSPIPHLLSTENQPGNLEMAGLNNFFIKARNMSSKKNPIKIISLGLRSKC